MGANTWTRVAWTDERIKKLKLLYESGYSCSNIAERLGGVTRNAVIGKIHRMNLPLRGNEIPKIRKKISRRKPNPYAWERAHTPRSAKAVNASPADLEDLANIEARQANDVARTSFVDLEDHHCRFIVGDPKGEHGYCGQERVHGLPYCKHHALRCYQPPKPKSKSENPPALRAPWQDNRILNLEDA